MALEIKHRGFAFVTYSSSADAQDAIDNMDLNELNGRVLRVNLARPMKGPTQAAGNRASMSCNRMRMHLLRRYSYRFLQSGNLKNGFASTRSRWHRAEVRIGGANIRYYLVDHFCSGAALRGQANEGSAEPEGEDGQGGADDAMEE